MLWALILTTVMHSPYFRQSSSVSTAMMYGFNSEEACKNAGRKAPRPSGGGQEYKVEVVWSCVPMGDAK